MQGRVIAVLALLAASSGCRTPTSVTTELSTDVDCASTQRTTITVGDTGEIETRSISASTDACSGGGAEHRIGSLAIVPSDASDAPFAVKIVVGVKAPVESCVAPDYKGCIVARRALSFIPHTELELPIPLRGACTDVPCSPTTTCVLGRCVSSSIDPTFCVTSGCGESVLAGGGGSGGEGGGGGTAGSGAGGAGGGCDPQSTEPNPPGCTTYYKDADGDGHGAVGDSQCLCAPDAATGYTALEGDDCDDTCSVCWTGNTEVCDGFDNDCDGTRDPAGCCPAPTPAVDCANGACTIAAGCFVMGSPPAELCRDPDENQVQVTLTHGFVMAQHEVTQSEFQALMGTNPSQFKTCGPDCPVENLTWNQAAAYCNALSTKEGLTPCYACAGGCAPASAYAGAAIYGCPGYRLPTEAEWEYAARAGVTASSQAGDLTVCTYDPKLDPYAWTSGDAAMTVHPVCQLAPNAWGLCDMEGNIAEWIHEGFAPHPAGPVVDPAVPPITTKGLTKGGSWWDKSQEARYAARYSGNAIQHYNNWGFRWIRTK